MTIPPDSRKQDHDAVWLVLPWILLGVVAAIEIPRELYEVHGSRVGSLLTPAPALAAIRGRPVQVAAVAAAAGVIAVTTTFIDSPSGLDYHLTVLGAIAVVSATSLLASAARERRMARLTQVQRVAEAAQLALLPPVPRRVGELHLEARYVAAESEARIGGDLYEVVVARDRIRLIIGDVRGKGLPAIRTAVAVLGAFREAAHHERDLPRVAVRCSEAVGRLQGEGGDAFSGTMDRDELFVTATVVEIEGPTLRMVNLGHPRPLLLTRRSARPVGPEDALPPLGLAHQLFEEFPVAACGWRPGERLLLYTDGIDEARDGHGRFFPLVQVLDTLLDAPADVLPDMLLRAVDRHTGRELRDDAAIVVVEWPARPGGAPSTR